MSTTPPAATGIELKLNNGQVIKAENMEDALKTAVKMVEDSTSYARETNKKLEDLQGQFTGLQAQVAASQKKEPPSNGFDKDRYYQLLHDDPLAAANYVDQVRFGVQDPVGYIADIGQKVTVFEGQSAAAIFTANHPEFPQDMAAAKTLTSRVKQLTDAGHPFGQETMEIAWNQLLSEGTLKPVEDEQQAEEALPVSPGGAGGVISDGDLKKAEQMTDAELQAFLKSKGML